MIIRSSWNVEDGWVWPVGELRRRKRTYACDICGEPGHNNRTCGLSDRQRRRRRINQKRGIYVEGDSGSSPAADVDATSEPSALSGR